MRMNTERHICDCGIFRVAAISHHVNSVALIAIAASDAGLCFSMVTATAWQHAAAEMCAWVASHRPV